MNTRQTSIDCYHKIKAEGLLSKRRFETFEAIYKTAPCTRQEALQSSFMFNPLSLSAARFTELRRLGVIYEKQMRKCKVTGVNVIEWDLTGNLPVKLESKKLSKKQRVKEALNHLRHLYINQDHLVREDFIKLADLIKEI